MLSACRSVKMWPSNIANPITTWPKCSTPQFYWGSHSNRWKCARQVKIITY